MFIVFELVFQNRAINYISRVPLVFTLPLAVTSHSGKFNDLVLMFQLVNKFTDNAFFI